MQLISSNLHLHSFIQRHKSMNDLISIIVPVYNVEKFIDECVQSLVNQTYQKLEIILVDDGSIDNSPKLCDDWAAKDPRIKVIHKKNSGVCDSRNAALDIFNGQYVSFVDSDDKVLPSYIEELFFALQQNADCGIASCCAVQYDGTFTTPIFNKSWEFDHVRYVEPDEFADRMLTMTSQHTVWCKLYRRNLFDKLRFRHLYANEELFLALDMHERIEREKIRVIEIPSKLYYYRFNPNGICHSRGYQFALTETSCRELLLKELKGKKPLSYEYYKKMLLLDYLSTLHEKLTNHAADIPYYKFCRKLWRYNDIYAYRTLRRKEFAMYLCNKYLPTITYLIFIIKK